MNPPVLDKLTTALGQTHHATLSGPDDRADTVRLTADIERSVNLRHTRSRYRKLSEPIKPTQRPSLKPLLGLERRRLARDSNRVAVRGEGSNRRTCALTGD